MNKVAVVTGGAGGIGQAVADRFAKDNYRVVILDVNDEAGKQVAADFRQRSVEISFQRADLTQETEVEVTFEKIKAEHSRIDVLVNVAGGSMHRHRFEEFPLKDWQTVVDANLTSTFLCCRAVVGMMRNQKSGADVDQALDLLFYSPAAKPSLVAKYSLTTFIPPLGILLGDADEADTRIAGPAAAKSGIYQSSFSNRMPGVSAAYLISSIDHGLPHVIT